MCSDCNGRQRVWVESTVDGHYRGQFTDCHCVPRPERHARPPAFKIRHGLKGDCRDYREDLARFPKDPQAYTDGPASVQKLKDQRLREGWQFHESYDAALKPPEDTIDSHQFVREAYERARAKGFRSEE